MTEIASVESASTWLQIIGLGCLWLGGQIVWVAPLPRALRNGKTPTAPKGSAAAFSLFWIDQYGWIGLVLSTAGVLLFIMGRLSA